MSLIESVRTYIATCEHLKLFQDAFKKISVDYSNTEEAETYSINETVCQPILKKFINSSSERQFLFTFSSIEYFGSDVAQSIDNIHFYELFSDWLESNSDNKILPALEKGKQALKIEAITGGYLFDNAADMTTARYQIQCRLTYFQNK
jgi:hypothetical protein